MQAHVMREKEIQAECASCFMVNLVASFKDSAYLYMLMECIMGGELFTYLQVITCPLLLTCFYCFSLVFIVMGGELLTHVQVISLCTLAYLLLLVLVSSLSWG